jgi:hypothetical protein
MIDDAAVGVEAQDRRARERETLALLDPCAPPLDGGAVAVDERLSEPALEVLLDREVFAEVASDAREPEVGFTECERAVHGVLRV